jgi:predicted anti-sigma-YlaC factor YlaD
MKCDKIKELLAGYQDGELDPEQLSMVQSHLAECSDCREELARLEKVKEVTGKVKFNDLPLEVWEGYWQNLYRRIERGLGWIFFSIGAIIMAAVGAFYLVKDFFLDSSVTLFAKAGVGGLIFGGIILLVSVLRERIFAYNRDRYREVER